jgi:hypothetical protein
MKQPMSTKLIRRLGAAAPRQTFGHAGGQSREALGSLPSLSRPLNSYNAFKSALLPSGDHLPARAPLPLLEPAHHVQLRADEVRGLARRPVILAFELQQQLQF